MYPTSATVEPPRPLAGSELMSTRSPARPSKALEQNHPLLASTGRSVDQQANRGAQSDHGATVNPGRLNGSRGATPSLKVTGAIAPSGGFSRKLLLRSNSNIEHSYSKSTVISCCNRILSQRANKFNTQMVSVSLQLYSSSA